MEYKDIIPETPAEELYAFMRDECDFFQENIITFKAIGHREAEEDQFREEFGGDFRENRKKRPARCWCSGCERIFLAEYISSKVCGGRGIPAGIRMVDAYVAGQEDTEDGQSIICPCCGEAGVLHGASYMRMGHTEQHFLARAYTAQGCVIFVDYMAEQTIHQERKEIRVEPFEAFVVDGKKVVKLRHWQRYMMGWFRLNDWETNKRFQDTMGCPWFYTRNLPDLEGTSLENAKLWEYMAQTYKKDRFYPIAYARTYLKHPAVENLITSGMGYLVGDGIYRERIEGSQATQKLGWINWKEKRPSKMLGLTREEMRMAGKGKWDIQRLEAYQAVRHKLKLEEAVEAMKVLEPYHLKELGKDEAWAGASIMKAVRYLKKTKCSLTTLKDYWTMARRQGLDLENPVVRWPRDLRTAHDRAQEAQRYATTEEERQAFARMTARCRGLNWTNGEICIRVAESPEELVQEGKTLHHCVGGYSKNHARGNIILFIRHARRPERSWFTLNVDVVTKTIIQNHGYRNEHVPGKPQLKIPEQVQQFVEEWQRKVLMPWKLPTEKQEKQKTTKARRKTAHKEVA